MWSVYIVKKILKNLDDCISFYCGTMPEYKISIYKDIETKKLFFSEIFNLDLEEIYGLTANETKILRYHIGIYDDGEMQSYLKIGDELDIKETSIMQIIQNAMEKIIKPSIQDKIIMERDKIIRGKAHNETFRKEILQESISFLNIQKNLITLLIESGFKTIEDLLNITYEDIVKLNEKAGIISNITVFPKKIVEHIYEMGFQLKDEKRILELFSSTKKITEEWQIYPKSVMNIFKYYNIDTPITLLATFQFEPEIIEVMQEQVREIPLPDLRRPMFDRIIIKPSENSDIEENNINKENFGAVEKIRSLLDILGDFSTLTEEAILNVLIDLEVPEHKIYEIFPKKQAEWQLINNQDIQKRKK